MTARKPSGEQPRSRADRLNEDVRRLEEAIAEAGPKELPSLVREHRIVLAELDKLVKPKEGSVRDQLAAKRAARRRSPRKPAAKGAAAPGVRQRG